MATGRASEIVEHLRRAALLRGGTGPTDGELLEGYLRRRDEAALAALVCRHGPMVWGVCRRVLRDHHDAEDAFQATFLVFVRRAASIASRELLANWLYGVAHQTALKARATAARRGAREKRQVTEMPEPDVAPQDRGHDLRPLLDRELSRLPDKYRIPVVLCDLEGKTRKEAAQLLGWPEGTVAGRLARARAMLAKRLTRFGAALPGGALAAVLSRQAASAGVPASVSASAIRAANLFAAGQAVTAGPVSAEVAALTESVVRTMGWTKVKAVGVALGLVAAVAWGVAATRPEEARPQTVTADAKAVAPLKPPGAERKSAPGDGPGRIFFWSNAAGDAHLAAVNTGDKKVNRLTHNTDGTMPTFPVAVSPDGKSAAYTKAEVNGDTATFKVYVRALDDPKGAGRDLGAEGYCPCWSPDGRQLVVVDQEQGYQPSLVDIKTNEKKAIPLPRVEPVKDAAGPVGHVITDWSRDGEWFLTMCLTGEKEPGKTHLFRVKRDGSEALRVKGVEGGQWGRFSPDGKRILYTGPDEKGRTRLFVLDAAGGEPTALSPELNGAVDGSGGFCWSPDGKRVAYLWRDTEEPRFGQEYETFLMAIDADGRNPVTVLSKKSTTAVMPVRYPVWR